jgi:hypothetical protein
MRKAAAAPCRQRNATSVIPLGASPQATEADANPARPKMKVLRWPNASPTDPPKRIRLASISM